MFSSQSVEEKNIVWTFLIPSGAVSCFFYFFYTKK